MKHLPTPPVINYVSRTAGKPHRNRPSIGLVVSVVCYVLFLVFPADIIHYTNPATGLSEPYHDETGLGILMDDIRILGHPEVGRPVMEGLRRIVIPTDAARRVELCIEISPNVLVITTISLDVASCVALMNKRQRNRLKSIAKLTSIGAFALGLFWIVMNVVSLPKWSAPFGMWDEISIGFIWFLPLTLASLLLRDWRTSL